ncbi:MAG TPA: bifunctional phosphopantothenoylcysteine decarboxylase/phosphopantothenate--cysteine ligase CoaBC [Thermoanaerobaculia bacterium]|nr:bifunctional phosphopantothenoylcysteine decarboxylase/phosphopantothenate--cysteine ligase CoaBC [Thermoanaerobaculia bacterium]
MNIVLGVSGGIAAYKAPDLVRRLQDIGAAVRVILTPNAARFVSPLSLAAVSNHGVIIDQWGDPSSGGVDHIELARWADLLLIAPATANIIAKLATGIADDALTTYAVAHRGRLLIVPAMNTSMLLHPTVVANLELLRSRGVALIEPDSGLLACGDEGAGRMPDPQVIARHVQMLFADRNLQGTRFLVTAGPTREAIDPVRYISNRSSGRMGYAIAAAARDRGASVTLVTGPTALVRPPGIEVIEVTSAQEMFDAVMQNVDGHDVIVKAAAVADYRPVSAAPQKIKKEHDSAPVIALERTGDILEAIGARSRRPFIVAFAAETEQIVQHAGEKLQRKNADLIVANDVSDAAIGFDSPDNAVTILDRSGEVLHIPKTSKEILARQILDVVAARLASAQSPQE